MSRNTRRGESSGMPTATAARTVKVFLADDSGPIRARVAGMLSPAATVVGEAETPQACIAGILAAKPDVVVLDVQLLGGQGLEVLRAVRAAQPAVAFVVFSNNSQAAYRKRYLAEGATRFLDKSSESGQLAAAVRAASESVPH
jgi:DNA-binding NarL/FixJ family response regulator